MIDNMISLRSLSNSDILLLEDIVIIISDTANIFHGTKVVIRAEHTITFLERISHSKEFLIESYSLDMSIKDFLSLLSKERHKTLSGKVLHGNTIMGLLGFNDLVLTSTAAIQIGADSRTLIKSNKLMSGLLSLSKVLALVKTLRFFSVSRRI